MKQLVLLLLLMTATFLRAAEPEVHDKVYDLKRFDAVHVYQGSERPREVAVFLSGDGGWNKGVVDMAKAIARHDTLVIGVDVPRYLKNARLDKKKKCTYPAGDFEMLAQVIQKQLGYADYQRPFLMGYSSGATLAYAALVQGPSGAFKGALSLGFCSDLEFQKPLCEGEGLHSRPLAKGKGYDFSPAPHLKPRWIALNGEMDKVCAIDGVRAFVKKVEHGELVALPNVGHGFGHEKDWMPQFVEAYQKLALQHGQEEAQERASRSHADREIAAEARELPLVEVPARKDSAKDAMAILLTGDGGWAGFDRRLSADLAEKGINVVGFDSLKYFWAPKAFDRAARDLSVAIDAYTKKWGAKGVVLIGYSFGADILPSLINHLPKVHQDHIVSVVLISPSQTGSNEIHVMEWFGRKDGPGFATQPALAKLAVKKLQCIYGKEDKGSICPSLKDRAEVIGYESGHMMNAFVKQIAAAILP